MGFLIPGSQVRVLPGVLVHYSSYDRWRFARTFPGSSDIRHWLASEFQHCLRRILPFFFKPLSVA